MATEIPLTFRVAEILPDMFLPSSFLMFDGGIIFVYVPGIELVTLTAIVQVRVAAIDPPVQVNWVPPAVAVSVPPTQYVLFAAFGVAAITTPTGRASVIEKLLREVSPGAVNEMLNRDTPPRAMEAGEKLFDAEVIPSPLA